MLHNMDAKYRTLSLKHLLWTALALGILADLLVWDRGPTASGFALWVLCFTGSFLALQLPTGLPRPTLPWLLLPPVAAGMLVWRAHEIHVFLVLLLLTLATTLVVALPRSSGSLELRIPALLRAFFHALARLAFGLALWQSRIRSFIHGSLALGACLLLLWMADNPAARVASLNLQRHIESDLPLDTWYLHLLGTDAVPAVLEHFDALQEPQRCDIARQLLAARNAWQVAADEGWRHFSLSRSRALRAVAVREASLQALAADERTCPVSSPG